MAAVGLRTRPVPRHADLGKGVRVSDGVEFLWGLILVLSRFVLAMIGFAIGFAAVFALTAGNNHALRILVGLVARVVAALGGLGRYVSPGSLLRLRH